MLALVVGSIIIAYLVGSIPSTVIVGWAMGNRDMRSEPDGRVSPSAVFHTLGMLPFLITVAMDMSFAATAVLTARLLNDSSSIVLLAGCAAVAGHNWSPFLKFKGGLGATAICGVLLTIVFWQIWYGLAAGAIVLFATHKSGLSTLITIVTTSAVIFTQTHSGVLTIFPITLLLLMLIKRAQVARASKTIH